LVLDKRSTTGLLVDVGVGWLVRFVISAKISFAVCCGSGRPGMFTVFIVVSFRLIVVLRCTAPCDDLVVTALLHGLRCFSSALGGCYTVNIDVRYDGEQFSVLKHLALRPVLQKNTLDWSPPACFARSEFFEAKG
jgi:hypothetical protein